MSFPEKPYPKDSDILRKEVKGEHILVINHTRKIIKNGNTTVIYLRHNSETEKEPKNNEFNDDNEIKKELVTSEHMSNCTKCRLKLHNKVDKITETLNQKICTLNEKENPVDKIKTKNETEDTFPVCKSENNLTYLNSIKHRSNLTMPSVALTRRHTFDIASNQKSKNSLSEETKLISVPEHVPVKMLISNLEVNKTQKKISVVF